MLNYPQYEKSRARGVRLVGWYVAGLFAEAVVVLGVAEHLRHVAFAVGDFDVGYIAVIIVDGFIHRIDEALVGGDAELGVALEHFLMQLGIDLDGIALYEVGTGGVVAFAFDALDLAEKLPEEVAQSAVVVDFYVSLAAALGEFDHLVLFAVLVGPAGDELAVAHVGLLDVLARLDAHELCHEAVEHIFVVFGLIGVGVVAQTEFDELGIGEIVEGEEVGAGFFEWRSVGLECIGIDTGEETARSVAEAFVEVGV